MDNQWNPEGRRFGYIDGDLLIYAGANKFDKADSFDPLAMYLDEEILWIAEQLALDDWRIFVTAGGNFRYGVYPEYKGNRRARPKPRFLGECYRYLYESWGARAERGYEADDLLGIALTDDPSGILISYDKDLDQVPGWHFNWRKRHAYDVVPSSATRFLAVQALAGDSTDNIPGIKGVGPKKAEAILGEEASLEEYLEKITESYRDHGIDYDTFEQYYKCVKILTTHEQEWPELEGLRY